MQKETLIRKKIQITLSNLGITTWRNNTGKLRNKEGNFVSYGLCVGSSDLIGITPVRITKDMVGKVLGVFIAIELKKEKKDGGKGLTVEQENFIRHINEQGGISGIARNEEDAIYLINNKKWL